MSKLRISVVEFLNTAPLVWGFAGGPLDGRYDLSYTVPSLCAEALRAGQADVAIIPSIEYQRMDNLVMLPDMAIAAKREVQSILVLSKKPIDNVRRIAMDTSSRSSVALTRLLCRGLWRIAPEFIDTPSNPAAMLAEADAALLIGDPALRVRLKVDALHARSLSSAQAIDASFTAAAPAVNAAPADKSCGCGGADASQPIPGVNTLFVYDVAHEWRRMTGKPCVLAIWAGRRDAVTPEVAADFLASKQYGLAHIDEIAESAALKLDLPPQALERYLRESIDYSLDAENLEGLRLYFTLAAEAGLIPQARAIEFLAIPERTGHAQERR